MADVRSLLDEHEAGVAKQLADLEREMSGLRDQTILLLEELRRVQTAKAAIGTNKVLALPARGNEASRNSMMLRQKNAPRAELSVLRMTIKQLILKALHEDFPHGANANQLLQFFAFHYGRRDITRTSLSPQLSRLKKDDGLIELKGKIWTLAEPREPEIPFAENEPPTGKPKGGSETALPAQ